MLPAIQHPRRLESVMTVPFLHNCMYLVYKTYSHNSLYFSLWHLILSENTEWKAGSLLERSQAGPAAPDRTQWLTVPSCALGRRNANMLSFPIKRRCSLYSDTSPTVFPSWHLVLFTFKCFSSKLFSSSPTKLRNPSIHELTPQCGTKMLFCLFCPNKLNLKFSQETEFRRRSGFLGKGMCFLNISDIFFLLLFLPSLARCGRWNGPHAGFFLSRRAAF